MSDPKPEAGVQRQLTDDLRGRRLEAVDRLLAEHGVEIQAIAQVILRDPDEAADVLEATIVAAWDGARRLRDDAALRAWLLRAATRLALGRRPGEARLTAAGALLGRPDDGAGGLPETQRIILESLALLSPRERAVIALTCLASLRVDEAARALGVRPSAAATLLRGALTRLDCSLVDDAAAGATIVELHRV
jgi:RNA polymerase sigma-70 factor, ECF subfamily